MKLKPMQWFWIAGTVAFVVAALLDVAGLIVMPVPLLVAIPLILLAISLAVGPSLKELSRVNRRG